MSSYKTLSPISLEYQNFKSISEIGGKLLVSFKKFLSEREEITIEEDDNALHNEFNFELMNHSFTTRIQSNVIDEHRFNSGSLSVFLNHIEIEHPVKITESNFNLHGIINFTDENEYYDESFAGHFYIHFYNELKKYLKSNNLHFYL